MYGAETLLAAVLTAGETWARGGGWAAENGGVTGGETTVGSGESKGYLGPYPQRHKVVCLDPKTVSRCEF